MDLTSELQAALEEAERRAKELVASGDNRRAAGEYARCAHLLGQIAKQTRSAKLRRQRLDRSRRYRERADRLRSHNTASTTDRGVPSEDGAPDDGDELTARVRALVRTADVHWGQIAGLDDTKSQIRSLFAIALAEKPAGVMVEARPNILLYGPPGTGKTLIAAATSRGLDATFYSIKAGDLLSKYFGESPRLVERLYVEAQRSAPSVIFLDEMEALTPDRDGAGGLSGPEARILSQFLAELDGLDSKSSGSMVITIAATNKPWLLDDAMLSRFARTVYVALPNDEARRELFRISIEGQGYTCEASWEELAAVSDGQSGREIAAACKEAARNMLLRANPGLDDKVDEGAAAIRSYRLRTLPIAESEIVEALSRVRPATDVDTLARYTSWRGGD